MTKTIKSYRMTRFALALAFGATLGACEDLPRPTPKASPPVAATIPQPAPVTPPPAPVVPPEVKADETITKTEEEPKKLDACATARKLLDEGEVKEALVQAQQAVTETPKRSAAWNVLGRAQLRSGKLQAAIESFEKAVELNPRNVYAHNNLGLALIYDHQYEEAVDVLEEAVLHDHVEGYMWNNLGKAVEQKSDRARDSLTRLEGVKSVIRTAKLDGVDVDAKEPATVTQ